VSRPTIDGEYNFLFMRKIFWVSFRVLPKSSAQSAWNTSDVIAVLPLANRANKQQSS